MPGWHLVGRTDWRNDKTTAKSLCGIYTMHLPNRKAPALMVEMSTGKHELVAYFIDEKAREDFDKVLDRMLISRKIVLDEVED